METSDRDIVSAFRAALSDRIGHQRFDLWFALDECITIEGPAVVIQMPDEFSLDRIRKGFSEDIREVASQMIGVGRSVVFRLGGASNRKRRVQSGSVDNVPGMKQALATTTVPSLSNAATEQPNESKGSYLKRLARFESYVVGDNSKLAYTAATMVPERLGHVSPLYMYGPTGSGKTHLLQSIYSATRRSQRNAKCVMLSAEQFTSLFLDALQGQGLPSFRRKYREIDLLIVDDVQFLAGKKATVVEFLHTIDTLLRAGKQVVVSSDRTPAELSCLGEELSARLASGLVCGVVYPEVETRFKIALQIANQRGLNVKQSVLKLIAAETAGDARQIQGALNRIDAMGRILGEVVSLDTARSSLADLFQATRRIVSMPDIEKAVCEVFGLESKSLKSARKAKVVSQPRMLAMWLARKYTRSALSEIGDFFGGRSHSTVVAAQKKVNCWVEDKRTLQIAQTECTISDAIRRIEANIQAG